MKIKWLLGILLVAVAIPVALSLRTDRPVTTKSDQAYNFYLEGIENANRLYNAEALDNFEAAVNLDSTFASAWAYLGKYYSVMGRKEEAAVAAEQAYRLAAKLPERERLNISLVTAGVRQDYSSFEEDLEYMLKKYPDEIEPHLIKAGTYWKKGEIEKAINEYENVYKINPNYALVYNSLGYLHAQMGYYSKAIEYMKKYVFIAPDQANPYDSLGDILIRIGRYREALEQFDKAIAVKPTLAIEPSNLGYAIQYHMATALLRLGKLQEAKYRFKRALDLSTGDWAQEEVTAAMTELYRTQDQCEEAVDALLKARNPERYNIMVDLNLGLIYSDLGNVDSIEDLIEENRKYTIKCVQKCVKDSIKITDKNYQTFANHCSRCGSLTKNAHLLEAYRTRALGHYHQAAEQVETLIAKEEVSRTKMFFIYFSGSLYHEAGEYVKALQVLQPFVEVNPNDPDVVLIRAKSMISLGDTAEAKKTLKMFSHSTEDADGDWIPRVEALAMLAELDPEPITYN